MNICEERWCNGKNTDLGVLHFNTPYRNRVFCLVVTVSESQLPHLQNRKLSFVIDIDAVHQFLALVLWGIWGNPFFPIEVTHGAVTFFGQWNVSGVMSFLGRSINWWNVKEVPVFSGTVLEAHVDMMWSCKSEPPHGEEPPSRIMWIENLAVLSHWELLSQGNLPYPD